LREYIGVNLHLLTTPLEADLLRILIEPAKYVGYEFEDSDLPLGPVRVAAFVVVFFGFFIGVLFLLFGDRENGAATAAAPAPWSG